MYDVIACVDLKVQMMDDYVKVVEMLWKKTVQLFLLL